MLKELIEEINAVAAVQPSIGDVIDDPVTVDSLPDITYAAFSHEVISLSSTSKGYFEITMNLYYIDRVFDGGNDRSPDNRLDIQDTALVVLENIIRTLPVRIAVLDTSYQVFTHRFRDLCAGAIANVTFRVPFTICFD